MMSKRLDPSLLALLRDPRTRASLVLEADTEDAAGVISGVLVEPRSGRRYPIRGGIPRFLAADDDHRERGVDYARADPSARWKNAVRRHPRLTRLLQWLFDPAHVSHRRRDRLLADLPPGALVLNLGAGVKRLPGVRSINLDLDEYGHVDLIADGQGLPLADGGFDGVVMEYVIEHVPDPRALLGEACRVLKAGGFLYLTVPFMQSYHGNPGDYYRFTRQGLEHYLSDYVEPVLCRPFGGPASALVNMVKEFLAVLLCCNSPVLHALLAQLLIIPLFPLKYLDLILVHLQPAHGMAFSLQFIGRKPG
ncbi:MAG: methyltransferase domain-containing protein [Magnetococcales bacterium]|nr:methyltransferase domain-containing protein [Magnetococcales bacterium]